MNHEALTNWDAPWCTQMGWCDEAPQQNWSTLKLELLFACSWYMHQRLELLPCNNAQLEDLWYPWKLLAIGIPILRGWQKLPCPCPVHDATVVVPWCNPTLLMHKIAAGMQWVVIQLVTCLRPQGKGRKLVRQRELCVERIYGATISIFQLRLRKKAAPNQFSTKQITQA